MNIKTNDNFIIFFIKYAPIIFVIFLSLFTTKLVLLEKEKEFKNEVLQIETDYYNTNKQRIKEEVERIYKFIEIEKENTEKRLKASIKKRVYEAHAIATAIYEQEKHKNDDENTFQIIKKALGSIIFNDGRGYIFMDAKDGTSLLQPLNPEFEGKSFLNDIDANGYQFFKTVQKTIENKSERFDSYYWFQGNNTEERFKKISFYKYFEPYDLAIGTGEYIQTFENNLKKKLLNYIKDIRYQNDNYIFVIDFEGNYLAHYNKKFINTNRLNVKNQAGRYLVKDIIEFAKDKKSEYFSYVATLNTDDKARSNKKISYIKAFEPYNWAIGTGFYTEALNKQIEEKRVFITEENNSYVKHILLISCVVTLLLLIISFFISKELEKRLINYKKEIEVKILESKEKDEMMYQQSKMASMGEMIANIAHQWRQPLNQISTISSGIKVQKEYDMFDESKLNDDMEKIINSSNYLSQTIDDFRDFFVPNKTHQNFEISDTIQRTLSLVESQLKNNDIIIVKEIEEFTIKSLENELLQVLINILKNAKEALLERKEFSTKLIIIKTYKNENKAYISIKDNANGIEEKVLANIFTPYFTTKGEQGTGLGLYMSKSILNKNIGGDLKVKNTTFEYEGEKQIGAEFLVTLPLNKE